MSNDFVLKKFSIQKLRIKASKDELIEKGRERAKLIPIEKLCEFKGVRRDLVQMIKKQESTMIPELMAMRHQRMMSNAFSFLRGTAEVMETDLRQGNQSQIPVMICGDAHLNNFGFFASPERQLLFGLNDFDETRIGNWESDLKRLMVSIQLSGEINGYSQKEIDAVLIRSAKKYEKGIKYSNDLKILDRYYLSYNITDLLKQAQNDEQMTTLLNKIANRAPKHNSDKVVQKFTTEENGKLVFKENPPRARRISEKTYKDLLEAFDQYRQNVSPDIQAVLSN